MKDPLNDIKQYSPTFKIKQVVEFFERKDVGITRAMIQNYIRAELLPPPVNGRLYTHKHLAALVMIDKLKTVFEIGTIKEALMPFMDDEGLPLEIYTELFTKTEKLMAAFVEVATGAFTEEDDGGALLTMFFAAGVKESVV